ncbi:hypothetical protein EDF46_2732 [Frondihabitans sp. PhB188]|uniref:TnpV protein n=1 Tax=Frondihabitans sp. PhB188 TaxID=2485200 RepID=UPI000F4AA5C1|nr:TnpV protein [Frondihabitans sp. PhB188]ROQ37276.1 hypothetical protein EDF46_2732 [Frondihabitans sp. PhB188]
MNAYGELAQDLWRAADERRFAQMQHRDDFFAELGSRVARRVDELVPVFAGDAPTREPGRLRDLRLRKAKKQAEEVAFQELIFSQTVAPPAEVFADA